MRPPNLCFFCKHNIDFVSCKAYKKIPDEIIYGIVDHRNPYKGDNGITFELKPHCLICANYLGLGSCLAFGDIPSEIITGTVIHDRVIEGDKGIRFKLSNKRSLKYLGEKKPLPSNEEIQDFLELLKKRLCF